jgi:hypothetical protein
MTYTSPLTNPHPSDVAAERRALTRYVSQLLAAWDTAVIWRRPDAEIEALIAAVRAADADAVALGAASRFSADGVYLLSDFSDVKAKVTE